MKLKFDQKITLLLILAGLTTMALIVGNLGATKIWSLFGIPVDGGIVIFPLTYILGDLIVEFFGEKPARWVTGISMAAMVITMLVLTIVGCLPPYPGWGNQSAYEAILGFAPRVMLGSLLGYLLGQFLNFAVFAKVKKKTGGKGLWVRLITSLSVARLADVAVFETVAFLGVLSLPEFFTQATFAYILGVVLNIALIPLAYGGRKLAKAYLKNS